MTPAQLQVQILVPQLSHRDPGWNEGCFQPGPPDSATMRQARWFSSAMLAKCTGWVAALGRPPVVKGGGKADRWRPGMKFRC